MNRVRVLLTSRHDYLPDPRGIELASQSGAAPGRRVPCTRCARRGRFFGQVCLLCDGTGWRLRRADDDAWDEYTGTKIGDAESVISSMDPWQLQRELERLAREEASRDGDFTEERYGWEEARERRDKTASYGELERALEKLRDRHPGAWEFITTVYDPAGVTSTSSRETEREVVRWIALEMRGAVRVPRWAYEAELEEIAGDVRRLQAEGYDEREIATELGLSRRRVRSLLVKRIEAKS